MTATTRAVNAGSRNISTNFNSKQIISKSPVLNNPKVGIDSVLSKLDKVKSTGNRKWLARCPAHNDKSPSLGIKQTEDGKILIHCFAGCHVTDIVEALGLDLTDLFPDNTNFNYQKSIRPPKFSRHEMFERLIFEAIILSLATRQLLNGDTLEINDLARVLEAEDLINDIAREVRP